MSASACLASRPATEPLSTVTASGNHHGLVVPPLAMIVRNNTPRGDAAQMCTPVTEELRTLTTTGHQSVVTYDQHLLVPYNGKGNARPASDPAGTFSTRDRFALAVHGRARSRCPR